MLDASAARVPCDRPQIHAAARIELLSTLSVIRWGVGSTLRQIIPQLTNSFPSNLSEALARTLEQLR
jgi:hypothetical protein